MNIHLLLKQFYKLSKILRSRTFLIALFRYHIFTGVEHCFLLNFKLATIIDLGANRGQFTSAVRKYHPQTQVIAFEPLPKPANIFRKAFFRDSKVIMHEVAIGSYTGEATIHVSAKDDSSSLLPISSMQERLFPGTAEIRTERVKIGPLTDYVFPEQILEPALLKIDVQGYELEALRGCEDLLERFSYIYVECSFVELYSDQPLATEVMAWLIERRWSLNGIYNMVYDRQGKSIQADFLFEKRGN